MIAAPRATKPLTAAILAGGLGTRLRDVVSDRPKVLAEVAGRPFLAALLDQLVRAGVGRAVLCTGYRGEQVEATFGDRYGTLTLDYSHEAQPLGTAGALRNALAQLQSDPVLVLNGDSYCDFEPRLLLASHKGHHAEGTLWLTEVHDTARYGRVAVGHDGAVQRFVEKGAIEGGPGWINAGIYLLSQRLLHEIPAGGPCSLERQVFPRWIGRGLHGYRGAGRFIDIGTPESYAEAASFFGSLNDRGRLAGRTAKRFVLLDRDGVLNRERYYLSDPADVELLPGVVPGLRMLRDLGLGLIVVTNQSGVGRGYFDQARLDAIHARLCQLLAEGGVTIDGIYVCPHRPEDACTCRKPAPELGYRAAAEHEFDPRSAFVIGDKSCDINLGKRLDATTILVETGYGAQTAADAAVLPDYLASDLLHAAQIIERLVTTQAESALAMGRR
jgi:histidinol-phosphate phosphatase family protein